MTGRVRAPLLPVIARSPCDDAIQSFCVALEEAGLRAYDGALLVVSHDEPFLEAIGILQRLELPPVSPRS
jgi:hypothetical protein